MTSFVAEGLGSHRVHKIWIKVAAVVIGSFGPVFFLGTMESTAEIARLTLDILSWPVDQVQDYGAPTTRFLSALTGGFLLGMGVLVWSLSNDVYDAAPEGVRKALVSAYLAWFVLDSAGSIASNNVSNAYFNVLVLLILVGPMWSAARS